MAEKIELPITLEEAKLLVTYLEAGDEASARTIINSISMKESMELFAEVGKLTRQLHESLTNFKLDDRIADLAVEEIPNATSRLNYVLAETEKSANSTMDVVEASLPITENLANRIELILPEWKKMLANQGDSAAFETLYKDIDSLLADASDDAQTLTALLKEVVVAQEFQDITGQVIRRVIELVKEVEHSLVQLLTVFSEPHRAESKNQET